MDDNKTLRTKYVKRYYVIVADRDNVKKYVSKDFPRDFQYTVKLEKAQKFNDYYKTCKFIESFNQYGKYLIKNAKVKEVKQTCELLK